MLNLHLVLLTSDTDCDGTSYGAHRISVPACRVAELRRDTEAALSFAKLSDQMSSYHDCCYSVVTVPEFRAEFWEGMRQFDRDYFTEVGYTHGHIGARWNPWVYDDTIGIPALDTRYDD
jgi:hypothetical protein